MNFCEVCYQLGDKIDLKLQQKIELKAGREQMCVTLAWSSPTYTPLLLHHHHQHLSEQEMESLFDSCGLSVYVLPGVKLLF